MVSLLSVAATVVDVDWVMTPAGIALYFLWNVLMITLMVAIYWFSKRGVEERSKIPAGQVIFP
jgi:hypothetical protein